MKLASDVIESDPLIRRQAGAKRVAADYYKYACCVICGLQIRTCLTAAHLDHQPGNNDPDNLAFLCQTHHWMYDAGLYPIEAIKLLRSHWQVTKGAFSQGKNEGCGGESCGNAQAIGLGSKSVDNETQQRNTE